MSKAVKDYLKEISEQLRNMPPDELRALIEKHSKSDVAQLLQYAQLEKMILNEDPDGDKNDT